MELSGEVLTILVVLALGLAGFAVFLLIGMTPKGGRRLSGNRQAVLLLSRHDEAIVRLQRAVRELIGEQRQQAETLLSSVQRIGLLRYDAFDDMGGHLSFSAALLDGAGSGLVITSINGRQDTRCYAKVIQSGTSTHNLTVEEHEAIRRALEAPVAEPVPIEAERRRRPVRSGS
jgi:uncharacterized protein YlxW (UPF0749 family)